MSAMQLEDLIDKAPEAEVEPPRPLQRPLEPADIFPMEALASILADAALAIVDRVQFAADRRPVRSGRATLAVQAHADIEPPQGSTAPISNFFLTVVIFVIADRPLIVERSGRSASERTPCAHSTRTRCPRT